MLAASVGLLALWFGYLSVYQTDDAYIFYRYADNIAHGRGFVFNEGEPVEGVSSILWTLVLVPFAAVGIPLPVAAQVLTALCGAAVLALLPGLSALLRGAERPGPWDRAAAVLLASHISFAYWSVGALETVPYTLLVVLALRAHFLETERGTGLRSALFAGLGCLMRPEAPLWAGLLGLLRATGPRGGRNRSRWRDLLLWSGVVLAFLAGLIGFRLLYFGEWLPNTYYAKFTKIAGGSVANTAYGLQYTKRFLPTLVPSFGALNTGTTAAGGAVLTVLLAYGLWRRTLRPAALLAGALWLTVMIDGGDWMVLHRFWVPALPFLALLAVAAARDLHNRGSLSRAVAPAAALLGALQVASGIAYGVQQRDGPTGLAVNAEGYRHAHHEIARYLRENGRPGDAVALMDIGIIGYESRLRILDISGLTDREIARAPGGFLEKRVSVESLLAKAPRFFVLVPGYPTDRRIALDAEFLRHYRFVMERNHRYRWRPPGSYVLRLFERIRDAVEVRPAAIAF